MSFSSSYVQLDGVEFKISDVINPPTLPTLPQDFKVTDISQLLADSSFDFSLETSVLAKISSVREAEKKMAEKEQQRKMQSLKRRADAEKRRLEEMMSQQREVLQKKREEFLEQKRKRQQEKDDNSPESTSPTTVASSTSSVSPTYENIEVPPKIPPRNLFVASQNGILTPQLVVGKIPESTTKLNQSQPAVTGQNQIWEDFEDKELDPFTNIELKSIDDIAELQTVLQNARIGRGLNVTPPVTTADKVQSRDEIHNGIDSRTPSPSSDRSCEDVQMTAPLYENISLQEVNVIATKLKKQQADSSTDSPKTPENIRLTSISTNVSKEHNAGPQLSNSTEPVYSQINNNQSDQSSAEQPNPNNPFLNTAGFGAATEPVYSQINNNQSGSATTLTQISSNFSNSHPSLGYAPPLLQTSSVGQSTLYANLFNPVSTGLLSSNIVASTNSSSHSPVTTAGGSGVANPGASKILPVSFGPTTATVSTPNLQSISKTNIKKNQPKIIPQNRRVAPKPPMPAPRKPAIPARQTTFPTPTPPSSAHASSPVQNDPSKGQAHLLPPYAIPNETNSTAPSAGYIHKSKQDRAKFAETVNKALCSLPQNPVPIQKKTQNTTNDVPINHKVTSTTSVTRTLSLKSSLIAGLTSEEQTFVKDMMSMGFEGEATVRAMQKFGLDDKEVVDHLIQVQNIMEQGYPSRTVQDALEMFPKDGKSVLLYLTQFQQLTEMGFPEDEVRDALKTHNNDQAKALDQLMGAG